MKRTFLVVLFVLLGFLALVLHLACGSNSTSPATTTTTCVTTTTNASAIIRLYYTYPTTAEAKGAKSLAGKSYDSQNFGSAYSSNGVDFTVESGARFGPLANLTDPDVVKVSTGSWLLFYSKETNTAEVGRLFKATATAPASTFVNDSSFVGGQGNISSSLNVNGVIYVYTVSSEGIVVGTYEAAADRLHFIKVAIAELYVYDPSVIRLSSTSYKLYYKKSGNIYCASSSDGVNWGSGTKIVNYGEVPGAIYVNNKIYLYYIDGDPGSATSGKNVVRISVDNGVSYGAPQLLTGFGEGSCDPDPVAYE